MSSLMTYEQVFERPEDSELVPVMVLWKTGGSYRDYICAGLASGRDLVEWQRGNKPPGYRMLLWEPRTIIKYNKESGGLRGLTSQAPVPGGYGVSISRQGPAAIGEPLEVGLMTPEAWRGVIDWEPVS